MFGTVLLVVGSVFAIWQIYVLVSGRAKFGGYTVPIVLLVVSLGVAYYGWKSMTPEIGRAHV
jgi:hypothetical protein